MTLYERILSYLVVLLVISSIGMWWALAPAQEVNHFRANAVEDSDGTVYAVWHQDKPEHPVYMSRHTMLDLFAVTPQQR